MSLDNYGNLQIEIADHLNRQDLETEIPTFIRLAEAKFERKCRTLQMVRRMYANTVVSPTTGAMSEYLPLPGDYLELKRARITNADLPQDPLEYAPMGTIDEEQRLNIQGNVPTAYAIVGLALRLGPVPDKQYQVEITYYAKLPKLTTRDTRNWLLADHPDYYLYASLLAAAPYLKNDERIAVWQDMVEGPINPATMLREGGIIGEINLANKRAEQSGSPLRVRLKGAYGSRSYG